MAHWNPKIYDGHRNLLPSKYENINGSEIITANLISNDSDTRSHESHYDSDNAQYSDKKLSPAQRHYPTRDEVEFQSSHLFSIQTSTPMVARSRENIESSDSQNPGTEKVDEERGDEPTLFDKVSGGETQAQIRISGAGSSRNFKPAIERAIGLIRIKKINFLSDRALKIFHREASEDGLFGAEAENAYREAIDNIQRPAKRFKRAPHGMGAYSDAKQYGEKILKFN